MPSSFLLGGIQNSSQNELETFFLVQPHDAAEVSVNWTAGRTVAESVGGWLLDIVC